MTNQHQHDMEEQAVHEPALRDMVRRHGLKLSADGCIRTSKTLPFKPDPSIIPKYILTMYRNYIAFTAGDPDMEQYDKAQLRDFRNKLRRYWLIGEDNRIRWEGMPSEARRIKENALRRQRYHRDKNRKNRVSAHLKYD